MRKHRILVTLIFLMITGFQFATAQTRGENTPQQYQRCATQEAIDNRYRTDPIFRAMMDKRERDFQQWLAEHRNGGTSSPNLLTVPVTIPVVVHIVLPNPNIILESDVEYLINRLNLDYSGLNPDSTNGVPFYGVRGHSLIRFCLAKRDPSGNFTNGIERRVGAGTIGGGEPQAIKSFAAGGLDPWNVTQYYNIWVGVGGGLLGIAPEIGPGTATSDGVCINYQAFANNPCYTIGAFNLGRTAVHEIGHNFGLYHTFQGGCSNLDMGQLTTASCLLPGPVLSLTDDTPGQSASTSGCPAGTVATGCAGFPNPPGKQYQNYMDYTDDACYSMFTNTQVERMHWVLENCRAGYLTSNGCSLPASTVSLDAAAIEIVSPGGSELVGCSLITYNITGCTGVFAPKVRVQNRGSTTLTSVTVQLTLNGTPLPAQTFAVNIPYGKSTVITLNNATLAAGANTLSFATSAPNGGADGNTSNDAVSGNYTYTAPISVPIPVTQDFVTTTFPPPGWSIVNPNGNNTWVRNANGNGNVGSAFIDNYNFNLVGQIDEVRTPIMVPASNADSVIIDFDYAHKNFPGFNDRLQVLVSSDCGGTFTLGTNPVFDRSGAALATNGSSTANYTAPVAADWVHIRLAVYVGCGSPFFGGNIIAAFRNTNGYGNNIFIDNISITQTTLNIFTAPAVTPPLCQGGTGSIIINTNPGPVYQYSVNNGSTWQASNTFNGLAPGNYNLAVRIQATPSCVYFYSGNPVVINNGPAGLALPQAADFVSATFPPSNFSVFNPNANNTWVRNVNGNGNAGSAFIDNYNFNLVGQIDELRTVSLDKTGVTILTIAFDLAHKNFPGFNDRLQVLYSIDCGITWLPTSFDRAGAALATAGSSTANYTTPAASDWVRQTVTVNLCGTSGSSIIVAWRNTNAYGNNIFLDNINIDGAVITVNQPPNQAVCHGAATAPVVFTGNGTVYNWTNNTTSIGLAASGTGNIPSFTAVNAGTSAVVATITVTPVSGACSGVPKTFTITVNKAPTITCPANITVNTPAGQCNANVTFPAATGTGSPAPTFTYSPASGSLFPMGTTIVTATATNVCGAANCTFTVTVNDGQLPVISAQPANRTVCVGTNATFSVTAGTTPNAGGPLSYQWQAWNGSAWVDISGATASTLTLPNVTYSMNTNSYRVRVIGLCTTIISNAASLYLNPLPSVSITTSIPPTLLPTQAVTLTAVVSPGGGTYQWFKNNVAIPGATSSTYGPLGVLDVGAYKVTYVDPNGCVNTSADVEVKPQSSTGIYIYPNPNAGQFHIRFFNTTAQSITVLVYDYLGQKIFTQIYPVPLPTYSVVDVDLGKRLAIGSYFVMVLNEKNQRIGAKWISVGRE